MGLGQNGGTSGHPADQGEHQQRQAGHRQSKLARTRCVDQLQVFAAQPDPARCAAHQLDRALARQGLQVLLGGIDRFKAEFGRNLRPGRR